MSQENVEIVRSAWNAVQGARPDITAISHLFDREHRFEAGLSPVEGRIYRRLEGFRQWHEDMSDKWQEWSMDLDELIDAGNETVVVLSRFRAKGKASGLPVDRRIGSVITVRAGRLLVTKVYTSPGEALEAAGLSE